MKSYQFLSMLVITIITSILPSCLSYYKVAGMPPDSRSYMNTTIDSLIKIDKYFILRNGDQAYQMVNIEKGSDQNYIQCVLEDLPAEHSLHLRRGINGNLRYKIAQPSKPSQAIVLNEVHLYILKDSSAAPGIYSLQMSKVNKIEILEKDKKRTTNSHIIGFAAGVVAATAVTLLTIGLFSLAGMAFYY